MLKGIKKYLETLIRIIIFGVNSVYVANMAPAICLL
jgi:hypothetical protein